MGPDPTFHIPDEALAHFRKALDRGKSSEAEWNKKFAAYEKAHPELAKKFVMMMKHGMPEGWRSWFPPSP